MDEGSNERERGVGKKEEEKMCIERESLERKGR